MTYQQKCTYIYDLCRNPFFLFHKMQFLNKEKRYGLVTVLNSITELNIHFIFTNSHSQYYAYQLYKYLLNNRKIKFLKSEVLFG